ncbi:hypothetical protein NESM_000667700 [Novymonas esmeraldas]|uniref:Uncharacterized protein n=1 Tax=Novymonas esmeraldas TaxID=1808958 RepID=A0AAW0EWC7_9TRYP
METLLPLRTKLERGRPLALSLESSRTTLATSPHRVVENGSDLVCVCDGPCCSLYTLVGRELVPLGTYLFRRGENTQVFCVIDCDEVRDYPMSSVAQAATAVNTSAIRLSADGDALFVEFVGDVLVVGTSAGYLAMAFVSADRREVLGKSMRVQESRDSRWCVRYDAQQCVCVSSAAAVTVDIHPDAVGVSTWAGEWEGVAVASVAASQTAPDCFFQAHEDSRDLTVLYAGPERSLRIERFPLLIEGADCGSNVTRVIPKAYTYERWGVCLLAVVYPDAVSFSAWERHSLVATAAVKNELTASFGSAFWKPAAHGARLYVLRSDARCLAYDVVVGKGTRTMQEIVVAHQVTLPGLVACLTGDTESGAFLCWRRGTPLARCTALLQSRAEEDKFEPVEVRRSTRRASSSASVLLLAVVPINSSHGVVCLFSTGECSLSVYKGGAAIQIAAETHPYDATSCLAFDGGAGDYWCVLGFSDGDIRVFAGGHLRATVRVAHCGAVDRLLRLPKINETDDSLFVSMSTEMGTVCFHAGESAAVSRTMCSPSRPLTSCLLDRELEYMFLFSETTCNLWHLPTCRLERAFRSPPGVPGRQLEDLLDCHWASAMSIVTFRFVGAEHYAIRVDADAFISGLAAAPQSLQRVPLDYSLTLTLLLQCLGQPCPNSIAREDALCEALGSLGLAVAGAQTLECAWCAVLMLCGLLSRTSDGVDAAALYASLQSLGESLGVLEAPDASRLADMVLVFFSRFYSSQRSTPAAFRHALQLMVTGMSAAGLRDVLHVLRERSSATVTRRVTPTSDASAAPPSPEDDSAFPALLVLAGLASQRPDYSLNDDAALLSYLRQGTVESLRTVTAALDAGHALGQAAALLVGLAEGHATVCTLDEKGPFHSFVKTLVREAFSGGGGEAKQLALEALERLVAQNVHGFLSTFIVTNFHLHAECRPHMIAFLAHFTRSFPYEAHTTFSVIADMCVSGLVDLSSAGKDAASIYNGAVAQLLRVSVAALPSVSLQPSLQHLAVGRRDGKVVVYNLKAASIVTTFQAHAAPILGVAYSGNIATLDIATIAETLDEVKVWRSASQPSSIASFFSGGGGTAFRLIATAAVPPAGPPVHSAALLIRHFQLNWLSPQCVEFSSPWHGKVPLSLP